MVIYEFQSWVSEFIHQPIDSSASKQPKCMTSIVFYLCGYKTCLTEYSAIVLSNSNGPVPGTNWWRRRRNELLVKETRQRGKVRNNDSSITPHFDINPNDTFLQQCFIITHATLVCLCYTFQPLLIYVGQCFIQPHINFFQHKKCLIAGKYSTTRLDLCLCAREINEGQWILHVGTPLLRSECCLAIINYYIVQVDWIGPPIKSKFSH